MKANDPHRMTSVTPDDPQLLAGVRLANDFIAESPTYRHLAPLDIAKVIEFAYTCRANDNEFVNVAVCDGTVIGFFMGSITSYGFDTATFAYDRMLYVTPDRRGGAAARMLIDAFERWATDKGAIRILLGITTGLHTDATEKFYNKLGYNTVGKLTMKEIA